MSELSIEGGTSEQVMNDPTRHSQAFDAEIIANPDLRARQEALNGLKQFDLVIRMVEAFIDSARQPFKFRPSHLLSLHREGLAGISRVCRKLAPF